MNIITEQDYKQLNLTRLIALAELVLAPLIYLIIALSISKDNFQAEEQAKLIMYMLIPIAILDPFLWKIVKRFYMYSNNNREEELPRAKLYFSLTIVKLALVAAIFLYGLVAFFLTNDLTNMLWFYLIGIAWSFIFWPRKARFERVMKEGLEVL